jgi:RraA family protein
VRKCLDGTGDGRILVVDGGGSCRCALLGDNLASLALDNGWGGIVIYGCVRDTLALDAPELGVRAIGMNPRPSRKDGTGAELTSNATTGRRRDFASRIAAPSLPARSCAPRSRPSTH